MKFFRWFWEPEYSVWHRPWPIWQRQPRIIWKSSRRN